MNTQTCSFKAPDGTQHWFVRTQTHQGVDYEIRTADDRVLHAEFNSTDTFPQWVADAVLVILTAEPDNG